MNLPLELWQIIFEYSAYDSYKRCILINIHSHQAILNIISKLPDQIEIFIKENLDKAVFSCPRCTSLYCEHDARIKDLNDNWNTSFLPLTNKLVNIKKSSKIVIYKKDILSSEFMWYQIYGSWFGIPINIKELFKDHKQTYDIITFAYNYYANSYYYKKKFDLSK